MLNLLNNIKSTLITFIIGGVVCSGLTFFMMNKPAKTDTTAQIESHTISGAPLVIGKIINQGHTTTIDTTYSGQGESLVTIPDDKIPAAYNWNHNRYGLGASVSTDLTYAVLFSYRYERIQGIGSIWVNNAHGYNFGLSVGAMYLFSL